MGILLIQGRVLELTDNWNVAAVAVPRPGIDGPVLLTQADISGSIQLDVYLPGSSSAVYTTTFAKTLVQDGAPYSAVPALAEMRRSFVFGDAAAVAGRSEDIQDQVLKELVILPKNRIQYLDTTR